MPSVTFALPASHRLDNDEAHTKMVSSTRLGASWRTWSLQMTSRSCPIVTNSHQQSLTVTNSHKQSPTVTNRYRKNRPSKHSVNTDRAQYQQKQDKDNKSQHEEQQHSHSWRGTTGRNRLLGSSINKSGGTEEDVKARIQKARVAFLILRKVWKAKQIKPNIKLRIFN